MVHHQRGGTTAGAKTKKTKGRGQKKERRSAGPAGGMTTGQRQRRERQRTAEEGNAQGATPRAPQEETIGGRSRAGDGRRSATREQEQKEPYGGGQCDESGENDSQSESSAYGETSARPSSSSSWCFLRADPPRCRFCRCRRYVRRRRGRTEPGDATARCSRSRSPSNPRRLAPRRHPRGKRLPAPPASEVYLLAHLPCSGRREIVRSLFSRLSCVACLHSCQLMPHRVQRCATSAVSLPSSARPSQPRPASPTSSSYTVPPSAGVD